MLQTSGEVFVPIFWAVGTLSMINIFSGTIVYVFNDMETLNMMMIFLKNLFSHLIGGFGVLATLYIMSIWWISPPC